MANPRVVRLALPKGMVLTGDSLSASRDGSTLAVTIAPRGQLEGPSTLALVPVAGGAPTATVADATNGSFSPDGTMLCVAEGDYPVFSTLAIVSAAGAPLLTPGITAAECAWRPTQP